MVCKCFLFWHSNELHPENPFGGTKYVTIYDMQIPQEMSYVPYTVFFYGALSLNAF
jgi:hypothetical protein